MKLIGVIIFVSTHLCSGSKTLEAKLDFLAYVTLYSHTGNSLLTVGAFVAGKQQF
jgi:hypothetical protein